MIARSSKKTERGWRIETASLAVHSISQPVIPALIWGPLVAFGVYLAVWGVVGVFLALIFAPAHMGMPIVATPNHDWEHQLVTTRNLQLPRIVSFFFIGLDYQVEHHLFPRIPHASLPLAARITRAWCEKNGLVYTTEPYLKALASAERFMRDAWAKDAVMPDDVEIFVPMLVRAEPSRGIAVAVGVA